MEELIKYLVDLNSRIEKIEQDIKELKNTSGNKEKLLNEIEKQLNDRLVIKGSMGVR